MRVKEILMATAAALVLSMANAYADDDDDDDDDDDRGNPYVECLRTDPIRVDGTIVDAALATPELSTLAFAVQAAGLVDVLNSPGPFTVYAPLNSAFDAIPEPVLSAIIADVDLLTAVLTYHVTPGESRRLDPRRVKRSKEVGTVVGQTVFYNRSDSGPQVNQSNVACTPVRTSNGTVWLIDSVLLPQF